MGGERTRPWAARSFEIGLMGEGTLKRELRMGLPA